MSGKRLRSGKILAPERSDKQCNYSKKKASNLSKLNMAAAELLEELKSMRLDLTGQITKLNDDLKDFKRNTNERLQKIESVMSKVDEIDGLKIKQQQLEADVGNIKDVTGISLYPPSTVWNALLSLFNCLHLKTKKS